VRWAIVCLPVVLCGCPADYAVESGRFSIGDAPPVVDVEEAPPTAEESCDLEGICEVGEPSGAEGSGESWAAYCDRLEAGWDATCGDCVGWGDCEDPGEPLAESYEADDVGGDAAADGDADADADGDADSGGGDAAGGYDPWDEGTWTDTDCDDAYGGGGFCIDCWLCCWNAECV